MSDRTTIEWTDATWNPVRGCTRVSEGCKNCYAEIMAARFSGPGQWGEGLAEIRGGDHRWTGKVAFADSVLDKPLRWKTPRRIFVNSTSDLFHEKVPDEWIDRVFAVMALAPHHTFQILTKRPERARTYLDDASDAAIRICATASGIDWDGVLDPERFTLESCTEDAGPEGYPARWPLPNVWLGTSIEDQATADARIPQLLATPAAIRFVSAEPLLGPVEIARWLKGCHECAEECGFRSGENARPPEERCSACGFVGKIEGEFCPACGAQDFVSVCPRCDGRVVQFHPDTPCLDWVICGGESGPGARPMHPAWARYLRDQCAAAGVPYFFKQYGEWGPCDHLGEELDGMQFGCFDDAGQWRQPCTEEFANAGRTIMFRAGKAHTGHLLDGREHREFPA